MEQIISVIILFVIIVIIGQFFDKFSIPLSLLLVMAGMLLSFIPRFPSISFNPSLVLNVFLPILIYQISAFASWKDFKKEARPISLLSVGHVVFITVLVAFVIKGLIPQIGWPLAFVIGAIISPPDDVAIVSIAEKIRMPDRIISILEGEGMLNDAAALTIFRFALAALATHQFLFTHALIAFSIDVIGEVLYGLALGYILGELRLRIKSPSLQVIASLVTPFLAYCPAELLGGTGIIAVVSTGFVIGHIYATRFTPEFRLISRAIWPSLSGGIQNLLFLLAGLDLFPILKRISMVPLSLLLIYGGSVIAAVIIGRFIWVYFANIYIPRSLFPSLRKKEPYLPWQYPFLISWAGIRGSISLAAALAVPLLPGYVYGANIRDLLIFLVFCVIVVTLILQGLTLPWLLKILGIEKIAMREQYSEHIAELMARKKMASAGLRWLNQSLKEVKDNKKLREEIKFWKDYYKIIKTRLNERIRAHGEVTSHDEEAEIAEDTALLLNLIEVERNKLMELWLTEKINLKVRNKLLDQLDHRANNLK